jgi:hypothetical protein
MSRVIMLLPGPDILQLANCHKYVTRRDNKTYAEIYTTTTIKGQCTNVDKILVIGHGFKGGFHNATIDEVADAIIKSNISLTGNKKVAFDTCYAGYSDATVISAVHGVKNRLKAKNSACNLELVGATGCSVTIGSIGHSVSLPFVGGIDLSTFGGKPDKRLVIKDSQTKHASTLQGTMTKAYKVTLSATPTGWNEGATSQQIKVWAQAEYSKLITFAIDFRSNLGPDLETAPGRKVKLQL